MVKEKKYLSREETERWLKNHVGTPREDLFSKKGNEKNKSGTCEDSKI